MNAFLMMAMMGRGMDPRALHDMVKRQTERRVKIFTKLIDILFGLVMFLFGDLSITVDGKTIDPNDKSLTADQKLNAILAGQKATNKSTLFRELFRPVLISAAEFIAEMMAPDDMTLQLLSGGVANLAGALPGLGWPAGAGLPAGTTAAGGPPVAPPINTNSLPGSPDNPIKVQARPGGSY